MMFDLELDRYFMGPFGRKVYTTDIVLLTKTWYLEYSIGTIYFNK